MYKAMTSFLISVFLTAGLILALATKEAHAYIDIASGSIIVQALFASAFGGLIAIRAFWSRITQAISRSLARLKGSKETIE